MTTRWPQPREMTGLSPVTRPRCSPRNRGAMKRPTSFWSRWMTSAAAEPSFGWSRSEDHEHPAGSAPVGVGPALLRGVGPGSPPLVQRQHRAGGNRRGHHRNRLRRRHGRVRRLQAPVPRAGPAGHRPPCPGDRDYELPIRPVLAAGGRAVGHHRQGGRPSGGHLVRQCPAPGAGLYVQRRAAHP
jgi:hypothetical protein